MPPLAHRFQAIDVMRGMTVALMIIVNMSMGPANSYGPLLHAEWHGLTLTDLVFPTFMFVVGASLSFTLETYAAAGDAALLKKVLTRAALIFLIGYLLYWFPFFELDAAGHWSAAPIGNTRIFGVLQRIALGYAAAALIIHYSRVRGAVIFSVLALLGYWFILYSYGDYSLAGNAVLRLDRFLLGESHLYHGESIAFDPEGMLSTLPAIVNVIAGYLAGRFIRQRGTNFQTIALMMMAAAVLIVVALSWNSVLPINKKLWTSSYAVCAIGIDLIVLAVLVYLIDLRGWRDWGYFFKVLGRNTLLIYVLSELLEELIGAVHVGRQPLVDWLYANVFQPLAGNKPGSLLLALAFMMTCWLVGYALDKKKLYLKL